MTLAFKNENRKILLAQTNELLFRVLIVFVIYSSLLSVVSFYLGSLGKFIVVDLIFNIVRIIALLVISKVVKNQNLKYILFVSFGIIGFIFSFITLRDYLGIFYGALIYCYITIIIISLKREVAIAFAGVGVITYLILFYFYPYKNVDLDVAYYLSQIGFVLIYNYIVMKVMEYFKIYENKVYDQLDLIEKQTESLKKSEERYKLVFDASQNGLWDYDMINEEIYYSEQAIQLLNISSQEKQSFMELHTEAIAKEDLVFVKHFRKAILTGKRDNYTIEFKCKVNHQMLWLEEKVTVLRDDQGNIKRIGGSVFNITEKKQKDSRIHMLAFYDTLTNLPNRTFFYDEVNRILDSKAGTQTEFTIAIMDLDDFKLINDILGHQCGDDVLINIANRLKALPEQNLLIARLGGDEFGLLFYGAYDEETIQPLLDKMISQIKHEIHINDQKVKLTSSIGLSFYPKDGGSIEVLLKNSELALYNAKAQGKNSFAFFNKNMEEAVSKRVMMGNDLKEAVKANELLLHYQPLFDCATKKLIGFEALVRWQSPKYGRVSPGEFIPLAEEMGIINEIGRWVYKEAGQFLKKINENGQRFIIAINVSPLQVIDKNFIDEMMAISKEYEIDPQHICIEITETALMTAGDYAFSNLHKLSDLGFIISIDDFGTGYSSLSYLKNLPASILKIDKSFIDFIEENNKDLNLLKTIISLGKVLNMSVVAEGVEREGQYDLLKAHQCDIVQGYLLSKPMPESDVHTFINSYYV